MNLPYPTTLESRDGFTLMELLISMSLTVVLLAGVWTMFDIFSAMQLRGERETARAKLTRGLYKQMQDDISQATIGNPPADANRIAIGQLAPPPKPAEETSNEEAPAENEEAPEEGGADPDSLDSLLSSDEEENPDFEADAGSLDKEEPRQRNSPFGSSGRSNRDGDDSQTGDAPDIFERGNGTTALPPEYAMVVGGPTWMMLNLRIPPDEDSASGDLNSNSNRRSGKWTAATIRQRVIYHYVAPEDLLANDKLTLGLTRWTIDWQSAPISVLIEELRKDEFSTPSSVIWSRPKNSGAGSSLSFVASNGPQVDREEIPEIRRVLFRYYSKKSGWSSQWNSVARTALPDAIQMRTLWHDPRTPVVIDQDANDRDRAIQANTRSRSGSGTDEAELLAEWDEDLNRGYGKDRFAGPSSSSTQPPEGYAEYMFIIPAGNRPLRPERLR